MSSCAGYFETLQRQTEEESFKNLILPELQEKKETLQRRLLSLQVKGDFRNDNHEINELKAKLEKLDEVTERLKQLWEA